MTSCWRCWLLALLVTLAHGQSLVDQYFQAVGPGSLQDHATVAAKLLVGGAYNENPVGDGQGVDPRPVYTEEGWNDLTLVNTVVALVLSANPADFEKAYLALMYSKTPYHFPDRHHFIFPDWNTSNENKGYIHDITAELKDSQGFPLASDVYSVIHREAWYQQAAQPVHAQGKMVHAQAVPVDTIDFEQLPAPLLIEVVHTNWPPEHLKEGSYALISDMGIVFHQWNKPTTVLHVSHLSGVEQIPWQQFVSSLKDDPDVAGLIVMTITP